MARPELDGARRRIRRNRIALIVVVLLVTVVLGLVIATHFSSRTSDGPGPSPALETLGTVLAIVGFVVCIVGGVRARRAGALRLAWNSPTASLSRPDRKRLTMLVRADQEATAADQESAVTVAEQLEKQRFLVPAYGGLMIAFVGEAFLASSPLTRWLYAVGLSAFAVGLGLMIRDSRRARTWLDHHRSAAR